MPRRRRQEEARPRYRCVLMSNSLVNADVVDQHCLRKLSGGVRRAGPVATHRYIQKQEEGVVVDPLGTRRKVARRARCIEMVVDIEADDLWLPLNGVDVETIGEMFLIRQREG